MHKTSGIFGMNENVLISMNRTVQKKGFESKKAKYTRKTVLCRIVTS